MSRFNSEAYGKLYPRSKNPGPAPETAVETFRPSQEKDVDPAEVAKVDKVLPEMDAEQEDLQKTEGGDTGGHAEHSEPDSE